MPDSATAYAPAVFAPGHLGELTQIVSFELVDEVLAEAGGLQQRVRGLPSRVVVYLVLAGALFESMGWSQVWARLTASLPDRPRCPAKSSITEAMRRVGSKPLKTLFDLVKGPVAVATVTRGPVRRQVGRRDRRHPGAIARHRGKPGRLPQTSRRPERGGRLPDAADSRAGGVRGTRSILDAVFGSDQVGELTYASRLSTALKPEMILLADRNFYATGFIATVAATGADFLIRAKTHANALRLPLLRRLPDGTYLSRIGSVTVRVIEAAITVTVNEDNGGKRREQHAYRMVTSMLDPATASELDLVKLYHERWGATRGRTS